jgi:crossover junction endodeoxyribonuclease RuvC
MINLIFLLGIGNSFAQNNCLEKSPKIILGIDPGTLLMGYCIIHADGSSLRMVEMDVLKLKTSQDNYSRLQVIYKKVETLIALYRPHYFAIEAPFFGKNVQSMLKLGRAQGVAIAAAMASGLEVCEYSPRKIKQSITGNGNADKEQVWKMLQHILALTSIEINHYDASDALAVAVCHHFQENALPVAVSAKKAKGWKEFIAMNPGKVK